MAASGPNIFQRLHKWAARQDENYLTESLAVLLESLLAFTPDVGARLVHNLTGGFIDFPPQNVGTIGIQTQVELVSGRPDLEIRCPNRVVWIEVKVESELRTGQLEGYRVLLEQSAVEHKKLVLLTRYSNAANVVHAKPDLEVRWYEVADWLDTELRAADETNAIAGYLIRQFLDFLEARNMTLAQVGKFMPEGLRALSNLMNLLHEAITSCGFKPQKKGGWDYMGLDFDNGKYRIAVDYSEPETLWFGTRAKIDDRAAADLSEGEPTSAWKQGWFSWWRGVELDSEVVHFYSRSKVSQLQWLEEFIRESQAMAKSIEAPDQPSSHEDAENENDDDM